MPKKRKVKRDSPYATVKEACTHLKVSRTTINRWRDQGKLKFVRLGRMVRIKWESIDNITAQ